MEHVRDPESQNTWRGSSCCIKSLKLIGALLAIVSVSAFTSYLVTQHLRLQDTVVSAGTTSVEEQAENLTHTAQSPISEMQVQNENELQKDIYGNNAMLTINTDTLENGVFGWSTSYVGSGLERVNKTKNGYTYDCLQVSKTGLYQVNVQMTFRITKTFPTNATLVYFIALKFSAGESNPHQVGKTMFYILDPKFRSSRIFKESKILIRRLEFKAGDSVCTAVSNTELIYKSKLDNYFSLSLV